MLVRAPGVGYSGGLYALGDVDQSWEKSAEDFAQQYAERKLRTLRGEVAVPFTAGTEDCSVPAVHGTVTPPPPQRSEEEEGYDSATMFTCA